MPRRFGVGTLFIFTTMYAALFGLLQAAGAGPFTFVLVAGFFTLVGLGQMLLFRGKNPRRASFLVGAALFCLANAASYLLVWLASGFKTIFLLSLMASLPFQIVAGGLTGYAAGCLIAGVFLVLNWLDKLCHGGRKVQTDCRPEAGRLEAGRQRSGP